MQAGGVRLHYTFCFPALWPSSTCTGLELLRQYANVDASYNLTPEELQAKVSLVDALIVRSGTKVLQQCCPPCSKFAFLDLAPLLDVCASRA